MNDIEILKSICKKRESKIRDLGFEFGFEVPRKRETPIHLPKLSHKDTTPFLIAEIKRASPSTGNILSIRSPEPLARTYLANNASALSILTEQDHFKGSLHDLIQLRKAFPNTTLLRKDFLQYPEEMEISYRAGADMVLIIAAMFLDKKDLLIEMIKEARKFGMEILFEIHTLKEFELIHPLNPRFLGINSRSLHTFRLNKQNALILYHLIKEQIPKSFVILESGIQSPHDAYVIGANGLNGMLCGTHFMRQEGMGITQILKAYKEGKEKFLDRLDGNFEYQIFSQLAKNLHSAYLNFDLNSHFTQDQISPATQQKKRKFLPLIKICGLTNLEDALFCAKTRTNMLGFILANNTPRKIEIKKMKTLCRALKIQYPKILLIAVIMEEPENIKQGLELFYNGIVDALQLHSIQNFHRFGGIEILKSCFSFYPCLNLNKSDEFPQIQDLPFLLLDSKTHLPGGSGKCINLEELQNLKNLEQSLFLAGGIGCDNLKNILELSPYMIDVNSKLESYPGKKDENKILNFFHLLNSLTQ